MEEIFSPDPDREIKIDKFRRDILDQTILSFLPYRQDDFLQLYSRLPGDSNMNIRDRIKLISDNYERKLIRRVQTLVQHSRQTLIDGASEFNWEADAWRNVFGRIRDDERLRVDKREHNYKATILNSPSTISAQGKSFMGKRIPDITFGLASYSLGEDKDEGVDG
ncbi:hypothetical protein BJY04DRAFT_38910 [Aspergillus karnatakaensis]|uniref:uncharacterized protein n=1 Tax=Aspergillus karnatakaensis TaxID=1810916 RepID=UPI003CCCABD8